MRRLAKGLRLVAIVAMAVIAPQTQPVQGDSPTGASTTLLPDGRWLILGGEGSQGIRARAEIVEADGRTTTHLAAPHRARAWHTATVLPDGTVLIAGGLGRDRRVVTEVELFRPATRSFELVSDTGLTPRAFHTATLLTDGRVLFVGGVTQHGSIDPGAEAWLVHRRTAEPLQAALGVGRRGHTALLLPDGRVWVTGGHDGLDRGVSTDETFDPDQGRFAPLPQAPTLPGPAATPGIAESLPGDRDTDVATDVMLAIRFSKPLRPASMSPATITITGAAGNEPADVVVAEGGRLAFIAPRDDLLAGTEYTVTITSVVDRDGIALPPTSFTFTTALRETEGHTGRGTGPFGRHSHHGHGQYDLTPPGRPAELDAWQWRGPRRDGKPYSPWQKLPPLMAPPGVTALSGQVLRLNGQPLADVTLQIGSRSTRTDRSGRFLLTRIPAGYQMLVMDGSTANRPGRTYGIFDYGVYPQAGRTKVLPFTIWMPLLDTRHATGIPVPTPHEVIVTTPRVPGLEVRIPENVILQTSAGPLRWMSLTQIPVDRPPFPLPEGTTFFFTPQAHGADVVLPDGRPSPKGVRMIMPNVGRLASGLRLDFWSYEIGQHGWHVYGQGTVSADGGQIVPDPEVQFFRVKCALGLGGAANFIGRILAGLTGGDPVDLGTGLFTMDKTDLVLPDVVPIVVQRSYRQGDTERRSFGVGQTGWLDMYLTGDNVTYQWAELILADGARVRFTRTSPGTDKNSAVMEHTAAPTTFYKAQLAWNAARGGWDVTIRDGTVWQFQSTSTHLGPGNMLAGVRDRSGNQLTIYRWVNPSNGYPTHLPERIVAPNGRTIEFALDATNWVITQARDVAGGRTVTYTYDSQFRLSQVTDPAGGVTEYTYDGTSSRIHTIKDARGIVYLTNAYDVNGRVILQTQADGTTYQFAYTLDSSGKVAQTDLTDPRGNVRRVTFNSAGYALTDTRAYGTALAQTTTHTRHATTHLPTSVIDALGRQTDFTYDSQGNVLTVTRLAGTANAVTTTFTYTGTFNQMGSVTDPLSHTTTFGYDTAGNLTSITDPLSHSTTLTYNSAGQPLTVTTPAGTTTLTYDAGDLITVADPLGLTSSRFVDNAGRVVSATNPLGQGTRLTWGALNHLTQITDPRGGTAGFTHDANGNLLTVTDARSNATTYAYNNMDRVTTRIDALTRAETYTYDNNGNLATVTDRKSQTTTLTYDALDRLTQRTFQGGATITYTWDAGNRLTQLVDSVSGSTTRSYDALDRLLTEATPNGTVTYTYDTAGRRASMAVPGQATITYGYDNADRLTSITQGSSVVSFEYDDANRRTLLTLPNGLKTEYAYDAASRLTGLTYKLGGATLGNLTYAYDPASQRTKMGGTWARTLLPTAVASATYDAANQQTAFNGQTQTFDLNGNLTVDGTNTYTWNVRNELASISGPVPASFVYDPFGRRQRKTISGTVTDFVYDGLNPVKEAVGATTVNLLTGLGIDEHLTRTVGGTTEYLLSEALGSTVALADGAGAVATEYSYEPFGILSASGTSSSNELQYTGREGDGTGVYYYRARYYHPTLQRFVSEDPLEFAGGDLNLYAYVANNPTGASDPTGEFLAGTPGMTTPWPSSWSLAGRKTEPSDPSDAGHLLGLAPGKSSPTIVACVQCAVQAAPLIAAAALAAGALIAEAVRHVEFPNISFAKAPKPSHEMPSWVPRLPRPDERPVDYADEMMKGRYGPNWRQTRGTGAGTEHNQIKKAAEQRRRQNK
jgi:RHS repeat-associated protein